MTKDLTKAWILQNFRKKGAVWTRDEQGAGQESPGTEPDSSPEKSDLLSCGSLIPGLPRRFLSELGCPEQPAIPSFDPSYRRFWEFRPIIYGLFLYMS